MTRKLLCPLPLDVDSAVIGPPARGRLHFLGALHDAPLSETNMKMVLEHPRIVERAKKASWSVLEAVRCCNSYSISLQDFALALLCDAEGVAPRDPLQDEAEFVAHIGDALLEVLAAFSVRAKPKKRSNQLLVLRSRGAAASFLCARYKTADCTEGDESGLLAHFMSSIFECFLAVAAQRSKVLVHHRNFRSSRL